MKHLRHIADEQLVKNYMDGSEESLNILLQRHKSKVYSYILRTTKNKHTSEDIFQDTCVKVMQTLQNRRYKENGKFLPWVIRISHNLIIDYYRANKRPHLSNDEYGFDIFSKEAIKLSSQEEHMVKEQSKKELLSLINMLPKEQKEIVKMRYFWELSFKEIAEHTDVSINTALGRMRYALINLRKLMKQQQVKVAV